MRDPRRLADLSLLLPAGGLILLTPPILSLFNAPVTVLGVPLLPVYIFTVWLLLIFAGWRLSVALSRTQPFQESPPPRPSSGEREHGKPS